MNQDDKCYFCSLPVRSGGVTIEVLPGEKRVAHADCELMARAITPHAGRSAARRVTNQ